MIPFQIQRGKTFATAGSSETAKQVTATSAIDTTGFQMVLNLGCCPGEANFGLSMAIELGTTRVALCKKESSG